MAVQLASLARVQKFVASALVANPDDMSYAAATLTDQNKYSPEQINDAIFFADLEIVRTIQSTPGDGRRIQYGTITAVANGASVPFHPGKIGFVEIKKLSTDPFRRGIRTQSIDSMIKLLENSDSRYGTASINGGRYYIDEDMRLQFTGNACQIFVPDSLAITAALQGPADEEPAIARGAISMLAKDPLDPNLFSYYSARWEADKMRIQSLGGPAPPLDMFVKAGG